jgi:hypothetical protein
MKSGGEETGTTVILPLLDVTYDEEKQQYAVYTLAIKTQKGYRYLSKAQEIQNSILRE